MTITANLPDQFEVLRAENAMLEAENLALRGDKARLEQHITHAAERIDQAAEDLEVFDFELADAIEFLRQGPVKGQ